MKLILVIVATVLTAIFIVFSAVGKKYDSYIDNVDSSEFLLKETYGFGFAIQDLGIFGENGIVYSKLRHQASLLYESMYVDYYVKLYLSQIITLPFLCFMFGFLFGAAFSSAFLAIFGVFAGAIFGYFSFVKMGEKLEDRKNASAEELPEIVSSLALLMNSGMVLNDAWKRVAESSDGETYELMKQTIDKVENGISFSHALNDFGNVANSHDVKKFASALSQSLNNGNKELCDFLLGQSNEMLVLKKQHMLQKGEVANSKLLAPIGIIFGGIIIIVFAAIMSMFSNSGFGMFG